MEKIISLRTAMPKVLPGVAKIDWGFHSETENRAHLQCLGEKFDYKVWLEDSGKRCFIDAHPKQPMLSGVFSLLKKAVADNRRLVDKAWFAMQIKIGHIKVENFPSAFRTILTLYPNTRDEILKHLDMRVLQNYPDPEGYMKNVKLDASIIGISFGTHFPESERHDLYLPDIFWGPLKQKHE